MVGEIQTNFLRSIDRTPNVKSFRFDDRGGIDFRPGQFFQLFLEWEGEELNHYFSFSNSPTEKGYLEFTKKLSDSPFSRALLALKLNARVRMKLPWGRFIFEGDFPKVAFISGGIGITPIRSICKFLTDRGSPAHVILLYSARAPEDIVFRQDFSEMKKNNPRLKVVYSITDHSPPPGWEGRIGRICADMVREEIPDFPERKFFVCGPPGMVAAMTAMLKSELKLPAGMVISENFIGY